MSDDLNLWGTRHLIRVGDLAVGGLVRKGAAGPGGNRPGRVRPIRVGLAANLVRGGAASQEERRFV